VEGSCEYGIEPSGSMKCWEVLLFSELHLFTVLSMIYTLYS
jgi:hypothetical protein